MTPVRQRLPAFRESHAKMLTDVETRGGTGWVFPEVPAHE